MIQNIQIIFIWLNHLTDGDGASVTTLGCLFKCLTCTTNSLMSLSTTYELHIKYNKCSENLLVYEGFILVEITMSFPPTEISRGGLGNICKYPGKWGLNLSLQTLSSLNLTEVYICIRYLWLKLPRNRSNV